MHKAVDYGIVLFDTVYEKCCHGKLDSNPKQIRKLCEEFLKRLNQHRLVLIEDVAFTIKEWKSNILVYANLAMKL